MKKIIMLFCFIFPSLFALSQTINKLYENQYVFLNKRKYQGEVLRKINNNPKIKDIQIFTKSTLLTNDKIDYNKFLKYIESLYPSVNATGTACLDIENILYENIQNYDKNNINFQYSVDQFIKLIRFFKKNRKNVRIGIYGIPYKITAEKHLKYNTSKLDELLSEVDVIFPSLYLPYSFGESKSSLYSSFLTTNLKTALAYGKRLGKPVIPFTWYMVHPSNRFYGGEIIDKFRYDKYLSDILNFSYDNSKVAGIVYWDSSYDYFQSSVRQRSSLFKQHSLKVDNNIQNKLVDIYLLK